MRRRGFSLMEVFLAALLVSAVLAALAAVIPLSFESMRRGQTGTTASNLARHYLDWWMVQDYQTLQGIAKKPVPEMTYIDPLPPGVPAPAPPSPQQYGSIAPQNSDATYHTRVVFTQTADAEVLDIDVYVDWQAGGFAGTTSKLGAGTSEIHYATSVYDVKTTQ